MVADWEFLVVEIRNSNTLAKKYKNHGQSLPPDLRAQPMAPPLSPLSSSQVE